MKKLLTILFFALSLSAFGQTNSIKKIYVRDEFRESVIIETYGSIGSTMPPTSAFDVNGDEPDAVKKFNDTVFVLIFSADFTEGETIDLDYTRVPGDLGDLPTQTNRLVNNQVTDADYLHWTTSDLANWFSDYTTDFNATKTLDEGTIIKLAPGNYGTVDIGFCTGITFASEYSVNDSLLFTYVNFREKAVDVGLLGHPARPDHDIKIRSTYAGNFGMGIFATGNIMLENLEVHHVSQGIQVKTVSDLAYAPYNLSRLNYQHLLTKYIYVHNTSEEAFYIGSDVEAHLIPIQWTGYGLVVQDIGRDAYQYRNGNWVWLVNSTMTGIGQTENTSHSHGFLFGTTTQGGYIENITGSDIWGNGILINGYGRMTIKNCNISSRLNTVYIKNYDNHDEYSIGGLTVDFICENSEFECTDVLGYSLDVRRDDTKTQVKININSGVSFLGSTYVEDGVHGGPANGIIYTTNSVCDKKGFIY